MTTRQRAGISRDLFGRIHPVDCVTAPESQFIVTFYVPPNCPLQSLVARLSVGAVSIPFSFSIFLRPTKLSNGKSLLTRRESATTFLSRFSTWSLISMARLCNRDRVESNREWRQGDARRDIQHYRSTYTYMFDEKIGVTQHPWMTLRFHGATVLQACHARTLQDTMWSSVPFGKFESRNSNPCSCKPIRRYYRG